MGKMDRGGGEQNYFRGKTPHSTWGQGGKIEEGGEGRGKGKGGRPARNQRMLQLAST